MITFGWVRRARGQGNGCRRGHQNCCDGHAQDEDQMSHVNRLIRIADFSKVTAQNGHLQISCQNNTSE
jgi:hypothetical protein